MDATGGPNQDQTYTRPSLLNLDAKGVTRNYLGTNCSTKDRVIKLAHDIPLAGYLGREKTALRILRRIYWPTLFQDV